MFDIQENLKKLPDKPGVYMHKDSMGEVIYVGKAISLRNRVRQYFQTSYQNSNIKVRTMVTHIAEFEYIVCGNEMEALILENNLIKKYRPRYNVLLRDDKTYPYIMVTTSEEYPRIVKTRQKENDGNRYFGPYSDAGAVNEIIDLLNSVFCLKKCSQTTFPKDHRACLNYHIGVCQGVCIGRADHDEYRGQVDQVIGFLSGRAGSLKKLVKTRMDEASRLMEYEDAARWRDRLFAIDRVSEKQRVTMLSDDDLDIVLAVKTDAGAFAVVFPVRGGRLSGRDTVGVQSGEGDSRKDIVRSFIQQYYSRWQSVPSEIIVEEELEDRELLESFLEKDGHRVRITLPKKGRKRALLNLALHDITEMSENLKDRAKAGAEKEAAIYRAMSEVMAMGGFIRRSERSGLPFRVESYDISNTNGVDSVGAMVVYEGIKKVHRDYRRYKIRTVDGPDDYASLQEVIYRRYRRLMKAEDGAVAAPDLILMDGGLGQVSSACKVLEALGVDVPVVGMAKDDSHRTRALVFPDGKEIELRSVPVLFSYMGTIQEEVHRYAIEYHRDLRGKKVFRSVLDEIEGVGPKRRTELLHYFKTVEAIKQASEQELLEVSSITPRVAANIVEFFSDKKSF